MERIITLKESIGKIKSAESIFSKIKEIKVDFCQENFLVFFLNTKLELIDVEILFKGGLNSCLIDPKTIFRKALLYNSNSIIVSHNHPSGDLTPSEEDQEIFKNLKEIGYLIGINVLDSIIFNKTQFYSSAED